MSDSTQAQALNPDRPFDIYKVYQDKLREVPPALAGVSALTSALTAHRLTTASEAISLLSSLNESLKSRLRNPIPASAGTDAFLQSLVTTVARPGVDDFSSFDQTLQNVLAAGDNFVQDGLQATKDIARYGPKLIRDGCAVVVTSTDAAVEGVLQSAAQADVRFKVIVVDSARPGHDTAGFTARLHAVDVPTAVIQPEAFAHTVSVLTAGPSANVRSENANTDVIVLGCAAAILSNGGVLATIGTMQSCIVAQTLGVKTYIVSETWKVVRLLPLAGEEKTYGSSLTWDDRNKKASNGDHASSRSAHSADEPMDVTPAKYITGVVTERGVRGPAALSEESIKIWF